MNRTLRENAGALGGHQRLPIIVEEPPLAMAVLRRLLATSYADNVAMERLVAASGLDWTIVRLNRLTNKAASSRVHTSRGLRAKPHGIARRRRRPARHHRGHHPGPHRHQRRRRIGVAG
jgi:hypothetical protein